MRSLLSVLALAAVAVLVVWLWLSNTARRSPADPLVDRASAATQPTDLLVGGDTRQREPLTLAALTAKTDTDRSTEDSGRPARLLRVRVVDEKGAPVANIGVVFEDDWESFLPSDLDSLPVLDSPPPPPSTDREAIKAWLSRLGPRPTTSRRRMLFMSNRQRATDADGWATMDLSRAFADDEDIEVSLWATFARTGNAPALSRQRVNVKFDQPGTLVLHSPSSIRLTIIERSLMSSTDSMLSSAGGSLRYELQTVPERDVVPQNVVLHADGDAHEWTRLEPGVYRIVARSPQSSGSGEVAAIEGIVVPAGRPCSDARLLLWNPYAELYVAQLDVLLEDGQRPDDCYVAVVVAGVARGSRRFNGNTWPIEVALLRDEVCTLAVSAAGMRPVLVAGQPGTLDVVLRPGIAVTLRWTRSAQVPNGPLNASLRRVPDPTAEFNVPWHVSIPLGIGPGVGSFDTVVPGPGKYRFIRRGVDVEPGVLTVTESGTAPFEVLFGAGSD